MVMSRRLAIDVGGAVDNCVHSASEAWVWTFSHGTQIRSALTATLVPQKMLSREQRPLPMIGSRLDGKLTGGRKTEEGRGEGDLIHPSSTRSYCSFMICSASVSRRSTKNAGVSLSAAILMVNLLLSMLPSGFRGRTLVST